ncbi:unnamed protein product [Ambrosiozyma monospora]|uniref:Unnamed protein product n=1 Tax=Ambrosiozyma monospora TaxID=43982 RepID=A0A9W6Z3N9_AMBMO|nr:unnamed protein product [Ambrosiozyma monospora]
MNLLAGEQNEIYNHIDTHVFKKKLKQFAPNKHAKLVENKVERIHSNTRIFRQLWNSNYRSSNLNRVAKDVTIRCIMEIPKVINLAQSLAQIPIMIECPYGFAFTDLEFGGKSTKLGFFEIEKLEISFIQNVHFNSSKFIKYDAQVMSKIYSHDSNETSTSEDSSAAMGKQTFPAFDVADFDYNETRGSYFFETTLATLLKENKSKQSIQQLLQNKLILGTTRQDTIDSEISNLFTNKTQLQVRILINNAQRKDSQSQWFEFSRDVHVLSFLDPPVPKSLKTTVRVQSTASDIPFSTGSASASLNGNSTNFSTSNSISNSNSNSNEKKYYEVGPESNVNFKYAPPGVSFNGCCVTESSWSLRDGGDAVFAREEFDFENPVNGNVTLSGSGNGNGGNGSGKVGEVGLVRAITMRNKNKNRNRVKNSRRPAAVVESKEVELKRRKSVLDMADLKKDDVVRLFTGKLFTSSNTNSNSNSSSSNTNGNMAGFMAGHRRGMGSVVGSGVGVGVGVGLNGGRGLGVGLNGGVSKGGAGLKKKVSVVSLRGGVGVGTGGGVKGVGTGVGVGVGGVKRKKSRVSGLFLGMIGVGGGSRR